MKESPLADIGCCGERVVGVRDEVDLVLPRVEAHLQAVVGSWEWLGGRELGLEPGDNASDDWDGHGHSLLEMSLWGSGIRSDVVGGVHVSGLVSMSSAEFTQSKFQIIKPID